MFIYNNSIVSLNRAHDGNYNSIWMKNNIFESRYCQCQNRQMITAQCSISVAIFHCCQWVTCLCVTHTPRFHQVTLGPLLKHTLHTVLRYFAFINKSPVSPRLLCKFFLLLWVNFTVHGYKVTSSNWTENDSYKLDCTNIPVTWCQALAPLRKKG